MPDDKIEVWESPTSLRVKGYFSKDPEKGELANLVWSSATCGRSNKLKEVLVVAGTSEVGKGAYAVALESVSFQKGKRYCRTEAYTDISRTPEEIHQFIAVYALPTNYELPLEIIKMLPDAFSIRTHLKKELTLKIIDCDEAMDILDSLHCTDICFARPLVDQKRDLEEKLKKMHEYAQKHIITPIIKADKK